MVGKWQNWTPFVDVKQRAACSIVHQSTVCQILVVNLLKEEVAVRSI